MEPRDFRRIRNFLGLTQILVSVSTGISVSRLSGAENGRIALNRVERSVLEKYYKDKLTILAQARGKVGYD